MFIFCTFLFQGIIDKKDDVYELVDPNLLLTDRHVERAGQFVTYLRDTFGGSKEVPAICYQDYSRATEYIAESVLTGQDTSIASDSVLVLMEYNSKRINAIVVADIDGVDKTDALQAIDHSTGELWSLPYCMHVQFEDEDENSKAFHILYKYDGVPSEFVSKSLNVMLDSFLCNIAHTSCALCSIRR